MASYDVAIIGGGFSGTMVAVNLARLSSGKLNIALIDRNPAPALGVAYGTTDPQHLLNVRAGQMDAFAHESEHFLKWLHQQSDFQHYDASSFVPRMIYGQYLQDILQKTCTQYPNLSVLKLDIRDIKKSQDDVFEFTAPGVTQQAKSIVLALGNFPPGEKTGDVKAKNPYAAEVWQRLAEAGDVLIIGTGLTSLDLVTTLARTKKEGVIHLLSRRGLLPRVHIPPNPYPPFIDADHLPTTALGLYRLVKKEIRQANQKNIPWQNVVDAMRPFNQRLWENLDAHEQKRFLRFLRPYWDTHRHRCAPEVMAVYEKLQSEDRIILHRGHIIAQENGPKNIDITWRPSGTSTPETFAVRHVVNCTGSQADIRKLDDTLVQNLLAHDLITPDKLRIGIATSPNYQTLNADNQTVAKLYALGSLLKGRLYESVAVPELRVQAYDVAKTIIDNFSQPPTA
jgi:uncharacterized NAD(P)/FAD-binding protein YdhS